MARRPAGDVTSGDLARLAGVGVHRADGRPIAPRSAMCAGLCQFFGDRAIRGSSLRRGTLQTPQRCAVGNLRSARMRAGWPTRSRCGLLVNRYATNRRRCRASRLLPPLYFSCVSRPVRLPRRMRSRTSPTSALHRFRDFAECEAYNIKFAFQIAAYTSTERVASSSLLCSFYRDFLVRYRWKFCFSLRLFPPNSFLAGLFFF